MRPPSRCSTSARPPPAPRALPHRRSSLPQALTSPPRPPPSRPGSCLRRPLPARPRAAPPPRAPSRRPAGGRTCSRPSRRAGIAGFRRGGALRRAPRGTGRGCRAPSRSRRSVPAPHCRAGPARPGRGPRTATSWLSPARKSLYGMQMSPLRGLGLWVPPLVLMAVIFFFFSQPSLDSRVGGGGLVGRKLVHFASYGLLCFLWWRGFATVTGSGRAAFAALLVATAYAVTDEVHQSFVEGRSVAVLALLAIPLLGFPYEGRAAAVVGGLLVPWSLGMLFVARRDPDTALSPVVPAVDFTLLAGVEAAAPETIGAVRAAALFLVAAHAHFQGERRGGGGGGGGG